MEGVLGSVLGKGLGLLLSDGTPRSTARKSQTRGRLTPLARVVSRKSGIGETATRYSRFPTPAGRGMVRGFRVAPARSWSGAPICAPRRTRQGLNPDEEQTIRGEPAPTQEPCEVLGLQRVPGLKAVGSPCAASVGGGRRRMTAGVRSSGGALLARRRAGDTPTYAGAAFRARNLPDCLGHQHSRSSLRRCSRLDLASLAASEYPPRAGDLG